MSLYTITGWVGALLFIAAYFMLSIRVISAEKPFYHYLNAAGGVCLVVHALHLSDLPNVAVNMVWTGIAMLAVYRISRDFRK
ncbi:hypothetical protein SAMN02927921_03722 [Sinomicrobium oceani]|uniref:CBU-0592-like domain-containing protein n=1 Tax=Sinomicrobium oceani TaxID=1150368 RepID=A0A1K1RLW1_9FLAO|nr:hypothetical protein [Sinomicrobium oceani]SFW72787.1 hypothetical protein SAMN02927921_03722 [Sinomicrobium oceani]